MTMEDPDAAVERAEQQEDEWWLASVGATGPPAELHGEPIPGTHKWLGGALVDGVIIGIPAHANAVIKVGRCVASPLSPHCETVSPEAGDQVTPGEGRVELFGGPFDSKSRYKWLRAVVVPGGDIYGIPAGADDVVKIRLPNQVRYRLSRRTWREYYTFQATDT